MKPAGENILIILVAGIGDLVMASPSIRAIRSGHPNAMIHLLTSTEAEAIAAVDPNIDRTWTFPIRELRRDRLQILKVFALLRRLRRLSFEKAVNLYRVGSWMGAVRMAILFAVIRSAVKIGHGKGMLGLALNRKPPEHVFERLHCVDAMLGLAKLAGGKPDGDGLKVVWTEGAETKWAEFFKEHRGTRSELMIGINPGGDRSNRRWPPECYALVGDRLSERLNASIVLLGGPGEETISGSIEATMTAPSVNLAGRLTLDDLITVISKLDLLVTNDSAPMHIAAAVQTPLVAIFGPENPSIFGPYTSTRLHRIIQAEVDCRPCETTTCRKAVCLSNISHEQVLQACIKLLNHHKKGDRLSRLVTHHVGE
jgi:lipopolysaccharide heptosyltransferase II